jgi:hypothetical protein
MVLALTTPGGQTGQLYDISSVCGPDVRAVVAEVLSGGSSAVLANAPFVDPDTTVATADQTGAATAPFKTIQQGVDFLGLVGAVLLAPGTYPAETVVTTGKYVTFCGLAGPQNDPSLAAFVDATQCTFASADTDIAFVDLQTSDITCSNRVRAWGCNIQGTLTAFDASLVDCRALNVVATDGPAVLLRCTAADVSGVSPSTTIRESTCATLHCGDLLAWDSTISDFDNSAVLIPGPARFSNCVVGTIVSVAEVSLLNGSRVSGVTNMSALQLNIQDSDGGSGDWSVTGDLLASNATFSGDVQCGKVARGVGLEVLGQLRVNEANESNLVACHLGLVDGPGTASINWDTYSASWTAPTGGLANTIQSNFADFSVNVPVLGAGAGGAVVASTVGTQLEGIALGQRVYGNEPAGGVAGTGGGLLNVRVDAPSSLTFKFIGPTTGGVQTFRVAAL